MLNIILNKLLKVNLKLFYFNNLNYYYLNSLNILTYYSRLNMKHSSYCLVKGLLKKLKLENSLPL